jgi:hypothetical protein
VAADKHNCIVALKHPSTVWLSPDGVMSILELAYLMAAAYILDNAQAFSKITLSMVLLHTGSYLPLADQIIGCLTSSHGRFFVSTSILSLNRL